jgi:hypothetical protein
MLVDVSYDDSMVKSVRRGHDHGSFVKGNPKVAVVFNNQLNRCLRCYLDDDTMRTATWAGKAVAAFYI